MYSLKYLYQIGYGPSSSHTMGPAKAADKIKNMHKDATTFKVKLYNSLALTGKGHLTEEAMLDVLHPQKVIFQSEIDVNKHPNYFEIAVYKNDVLINEYHMQSVGGGYVKYDEFPFDDHEIYQLRTFKDIAKYCKKNNISLFDYVIEVEGEEIKKHLLNVWQAMHEAIDRGLTTIEVLPGPIKLMRKAHKLYHIDDKDEMSEVKENRIVSAYAYAVSEENAAGGIIVTAPTCGACGILPAVLRYTLEKHKHLKEDDIIEALAVAGIFGNLIKYNASVSGAVAGCQAEVGSACSMAAAAHAYLMGLNINQIEYAAEIAMEHHLGLTCDPVNGYVQIPCIERNAVAALRAINASRLAFFLTETRKISFDIVVETMYQTGLDMHQSYKETSLGGLAKTYREDDEDVNCW